MKLKTFFNRAVAELGSDSAELDARAIFASALNMTLPELIIQADSELSDTQYDKISKLIARRIAGEPIAYILCRKEFMSLPFYVSPAVLIPRPETELLVEEALHFAAKYPNPSILDIGTGSGAIAVSMAHYGYRVTATDISSDALLIARRNAEMNGVSDRLEFFCGDLFEPIPQDRTYDLILSNPPYIADSDPIDPYVAKYEPAVALWSEKDGMEATERILTASLERLNPSGRALIELSEFRAAECRKICESLAYGEIEIKRDLSGRERLLIARKIE